MVCHTLTAREEALHSNFGHSFNTPILMSPQRFGHVYFLILRDPEDPRRDFGLAKVGITSGDVLHRVSVLQTGNPYDLVLFDVIATPWPREVEHFMHRTHAPDMLRSEWIRCDRERLTELVREARVAALRIENLKRVEHEQAARPSNGRSRRATRDEFELHREARRILRELIPATLAMQTAESSLFALTGSTIGVPGVVQAKIVVPGKRFDRVVAEGRYPHLVAKCLKSSVNGSFRWRRVPRPSDFPTQYADLAMAREAASAAVTELLREGACLDGTTYRTEGIERIHEEYLRNLPAVHRLKGDLAGVRSDLIARMDNFDALDPVCSFARRAVQVLDRAKFLKSFPEEYRSCETEGQIQVRKRVYPNRPYLPHADG